MYLLLALSSASAPFPWTKVYSMGERAPGLGANYTYGFGTPNLIETPAGALVAFATAYLHGPRVDMPGKVLQLGDGNDGWADIVAKRSEDGGRSWGPLIVICRASTFPSRSQGILDVHSCQQPNPVVDQVRKRILLFSSLDNYHVRLQCSDDDGRTWTPWAQARDLDKWLRRPGWGHVYAGLPGGIQLRPPSPWAGRLLTCSSAFWDAADPRGSRYSYAVYSDDHGETWHMSDRIGPLHTSECSVAQRLDGDGAAFIYARIWDKRCPGCLGYGRGIAESSDGGASWSNATLRGLADVAPDVEGSLTSGLSTLPGHSTPTTCFYVSVPHGADRHNLTVQRSCGPDAPRTWSRPAIVDPTAESSSYSSVLWYQHAGSAGRLLDLWNYGEQNCFWPPFPAEGSDHYNCDGGMWFNEIDITSQGLTY